MSPKQVKSKTKKLIKKKVAVKKVTKKPVIKKKVAKKAASAKPKVLVSVSKLTKKDLKGTRVLLRVDFNVPILGGRVQNDFRITQSLKTIEYLTERGARVIIISHMGDDKATLRPVADRLNKYIHAGFYPAHNAKDIIRDLPEGGVLVLENLRQDAGEENNNTKFAQKLADLADIYVNDAFSVCHRKHASVVGVPSFLPSYAGFLVEDEIKHLSKAFKPSHPFLFVLGGAKFSTKIPLVNRFLDSADNILIGGALANDVYKAEGLEVGRSLVDKDSKAVKPFLKETKIITPREVTVTGFSIGDKAVEEVEKQEMIVDTTANWVRGIEPLINKAKFILWNGPLGNFENGYSSGTKMLAKLIVNSSAFSIIGGGDTISAIEELNIMDKFSFVSTGGGAMLDFLANGTLPGIEVLKK